MAYAQVCAQVYAMEDIGIGKGSNDEVAYDQVCAQVYAMEDIGIGRGDEGAYAQVCAQVYAMEDIGIGRGDEGAYAQVCAQVYAMEGIGMGSSDVVYAHACAHNHACTQVYPMILNRNWKVLGNHHHFHIHRRYKILADNKVFVEDKSHYVA